MNTQEKIAWGVQMGEFYRLQKRVAPESLSVSDNTIYGLLNGIMPVIEEQLDTESVITQEEMSAMSDILNQYHVSSERLEELRGYYDIEHQVSEAGISRWKAIKILTYLYNSDRFVAVINKFDSSNSPGECRRFELRDYDI